MKLSVFAILQFDLVRREMKTRMLAASLAMFGAVAITACDNDDDLENAVEDAGK